MAFKQVADLDCDNTTAIGGVDKKTGKKNPTTIEGYFIGTRSVASKKSLDGFCSLHVLQTQKGNVGVWGKRNLDQKIKAVTAGQMIRISFVGMVETKFNPMYKYSVEIDSDNTIEVNAETKKPQYGDEENTEEYAAAEETDLDDDDAALDEVKAARPTQPAAKAQTPSPERQRAVQELLRGKRAS